MVDTYIAFVDNFSLAKQSITQARERAAFEKYYMVCQFYCIVYLGRKLKFSFLAFLSALYVKLYKRFTGALVVLQNFRCLKYTIPYKVLFFPSFFLMCYYNEVFHMIATFLYSQHRWSKKAAE